MITDVGTYFADGCGRCDRFATADCSTRLWAAGLANLRRICLGAGLQETAKWGHPCYMHAGRNLAIIGAFRADFRLTFFNAALMTDPEGVLEKPGPNTLHPDMIRFTGAAGVAEREPVILAYLNEAMGYADAGLKPPKVESDFDLPDEMIEALDADPDFAAGFHSLTPGRQKSYVIALGSAKTAATRIARVTRFRDKVLAGKGANER